MVDDNGQSQADSAPVQFGIFDWIDRNQLQLPDLYEERLQGHTPAHRDLPMSLSTPALALLHWLRFFGTLTSAQTLRSMYLFAEEVMPACRRTGSPGIA
jgi:hypothetical protein